LSDDEIKHIKKAPLTSSKLPRQEKGIRPACALPYELHADAILTVDKKSVEITFAAKKDIHGDKAAGAPFKVYAPGSHKKNGETGNGHNWDYAVASGSTVTDIWNLDDFENSLYNLRVYGPNGFYRELKGGNYDPAISVAIKYNAGGTSLTLALQNSGTEKCTVQVNSNDYKTGNQIIQLGAAGSATVVSAVTLDLTASFGWYDFTVIVDGKNIYERRYAGRIETGKNSFTDPVMGHV